MERSPLTTWLHALSEAERQKYPGIVVTDDDLDTTVKACEDAGIEGIKPASVISDQWGNEFEIWRASLDETLLVLELTFQSYNFILLFKTASLVNRSAWDSSVLLQKPLPNLSCVLFDVSIPSELEDMPSPRQLKALLGFAPNVRITVEGLGAALAMVAYKDKPHEWVSLRYRLGGWQQTVAEMLDKIIPTDSLGHSSQIDLPIDKSRRTTDDSLKTAYRIMFLHYKNYYKYDLDQFEEMYTVTPKRRKGAGRVLSVRKTFENLKELRMAFNDDFDAYRRALERGKKAMGDEVLRGQDWLLAQLRQTHQEIGKGLTIRPLAEGKDEP